MSFATDESKWTLKVKEGRQTWFYDDLDAKQSYVDRYWLGILKDDEHVELPVPKTAGDHARNGMAFFEKLLTEDGHWAGDYGGPMFLLCGLVIVCYLTEAPLEDAQQKEIVRYLRNNQCADGGWGLHIAGDGSVLCTSLNYVVVRILGVSANDEMCVRAREFLHAHGGALCSASWGKFWLSVLNVYDWNGMHPVQPELWLVPTFLPFHPSRIWCHARQIYLPMSYVYAYRISAEENELIRQLRVELYDCDYDSIDWIAARDKVAAVDAYAPHHWLLDYANLAMNLYEGYYWPWLRQKALEQVLDHVIAEDRNTKYIGIGPISKMINMLVMWHAKGSGSSEFKGHYDRIRDYLWIGNDGMRMQGTNGSQLWDTALAVQAYHEAGGFSCEKFRPSLRKVLEFLDDCQIKDNVKQHDKYYRQPSKGAFPFSTRDCGWIVSDCTAEGIKAVIYLQQISHMPRLVTDDRIFAGVDILLGMQNADNGFASYEKRRGPFWLETLNPSEVFGEIMVDYSYTECSSAVVQCLSSFRKHYPTYRASEISDCIEGTIKFIKSQQRDDGSWFGSWGVCFTYATWFALEALACIGETYDNSTIVRKACKFLERHQLEDGGWGESYKACTEKVYVSFEVSQVVNTSWALLGMMAAKYPKKEILDRAIRLICSRQKPHGEWLQEEIEGVFNKTCMISYPNYKFIFPIWALGRYCKLYENEQ